jgi:adenine-specific DNA-methyltransferase
MGDKLVLDKIKKRGVLFNQDCGDVLPQIPSEKVQLIITSPPYNIGKEYEDKKDLEEYILWQGNIIKECARIIKERGSICWQTGNIIQDGEVVPIDTILYPQFKDNGLKLRNRIIWTYNHGLHATKRLSGRYETINWFTKSDGYVFNLDPIRVPQKYPKKRYYKGPNKGKLSGNPKGKNPGDVWDIVNVKHNHPEKTDHPCQFPRELVRRLILSLSNPGDTVLDPFAGSGTVGLVCYETGRNDILIEKDDKYCKLIENVLLDQQIG